MTFFYILLVLLGGILIPVQAGINMNLAGKIDSSVWAALISFCVGTLALFGSLIAARTPWPSWNQVVEIPGWLWLGGLCGAYLVWISVVAAPKLGVTMLVALLVAGQLGAAMVIDHFGWLGLAVREISPGRLAGAAFLVLGALLIRKY